MDAELEVTLYSIIQKYPSYGLRRLRVELHQDTGTRHNCKKIYRIIKRKYASGQPHLLLQRWILAH